MAQKKVLCTGFPLSGPMHCTWVCQHRAWAGDSQLRSAALVGPLPASRARSAVMALTIRWAGWSTHLQALFFTAAPTPPPSGAWLSVLCVRP